MYKFEDSLARSQQTKEIVTQLRKDIILGKYKPGTRLIEAKIAEQMGISRAPIRTSFQLLAQEGLVINLSNGGTEVVGCSVKDINDIFELRLILERKALETLFEHPSFRYRPLFDAMEQFEVYLADSKTREITSYDTSYLDITFHRSLMMMAENNPMMVAWNTMANTVQAILEITNMTSSTFQDFYDDHRKLADMIIQQNDQCFEELAFHITNAKNIIIQRIEKSMV